MDKDYLIKQMNHPLSSEEISNLLQGQIRIINYKQLREVDDIEDLLEPFGAFIMLYEMKRNFGHWVCVFKHNGTIEHFDSYGVKPDYELKWVPDYFKKIGGEDIPYLTYLLYKSQKKTRYNHYRLQSFRKGVSTCGRWCVARVIYKNLSENQFYKKFNIGIDKDILVTYITEKIK